MAAASLFPFQIKGQEEELETSSFTPSLLLLTTMTQSALMCEICMYME